MTGNGTIDASKDTAVHVASPTFPLETSGDDGIEEQPLLPNKTKPTPLPKLQLAIACFARLAEPIAYTQIFPYINQMVEELHVTDDPAEVGFYSGLVDSLSAVTQLLTIYHWGRLSDRIGRKPVVISGLSGVAIASLCFGLSTSFWQVLISRAIAGAWSGNIVVVQSIIGEITDETNQGQAFPLTSVTWYIGAITGPLIGGMLSHPAERYPHLFGNSQLLKDKPYFLPCFASSAITVVAMLSSVLFLEESLPSKVAASKFRELQVNAFSSTTEVSPPRNYQAIPQHDDHVEDHSVPSAPPSTLTLFSKRVIRLLMAGFMMSFTCMSYETIFTLWAYTPVSLGGLQRSPPEIGVALAGTGCLGILLASFVFPQLHKRFHTLPIFAFAMSMYPIVFVAIPILGTMVKSNSRSDSGSKDPSTLGCLWTGVAFILATGNVAAMSYPANSLMVQHFTESPELSGGMFGLSQSASSIAEATAPAIASSLFALSTDNQILGGNFVWAVMFVIAIMGVVVTRSLRGL